jgi:hypothetical protein
VKGRRLPWDQRRIGPLAAASPKEPYMPARAWIAGLVLSFLTVVASIARAEPSAVTAFVSVNVVPMDAERVLRDQTVIAEGGKIRAIGRGLAIPAGARVIDGHGAAWLSPGLADMHVHSETRDEMAVYLANGVTTVLNMGGARNSFITTLVPRLNSGELSSPHVYVGFLVDGSPRYGNFVVKTAAEARALVGLLKTNGYDFIKVYNDLSPDCFYALVDEGRRQGLPVIGHGVTSVGLEKQLDAGQLMVAHTEEFLYTTFGYPDRGAPDPGQIPAAIAFAKRDRAFVTADLNTYATIVRQWRRPDVVEGFLNAPEVRYLSPERRLAWRRADYAARTGDISPNLAFLKAFTRALSEAGVSLITGTDASSVPGLTPGFSLHDDLDALEAAGLTRYQVLAAATRTPGELIGRAFPGADRFGVIAPGLRADLVLTESNPLDGLQTLRKPLGVMAAGRWYPQETLQHLLAGVAEDYDKASAHR